MIRPYHPSDLDRLKELTVLGFGRVAIDANIEREFGVIAGRDWKWRKTRHIDADATANPDGIFVEERDGEVIGYITTRLDRETAIGWIPNMAVHPDFQGQGIGKLLMEAALEYLRASGMQYAKIETLDQNEKGQAFYPAAGFQEIARQIHYLKKL